MTSVVPNPPRSRAPRLGRRLGVLAAAAAVALVAACGGSDGASPATTAAGSASAPGTPVTGGTLVYLDSAAHTNLYPPSGGFYPNGGILNQITDKLTYQNPETLEIEPWIAESWTVNDDLTQYTFVIRPGVTFSDGTALDAQAVADNYDTFGLGNPDLKQPVSEVFNNYDHSEVVGPSAVTFFFKKPSPGFLQGTATIGAGLVSAATLARPYEELGSATNIIGSGPFTVTGETLGKQIDLKVREDYNWAPKSAAHQGRAYLDGITLIVAAEDSVRIGSLLAGQADAIRQVEAYDEPQITGAGLELLRASTRGVNDSIAIRPDNPLVADLRVRQALLKATDSAEVVSTLLSDNYPQATSVLAKDAPGYVDLADKLTFDPDGAKALLDEAGWVPGADGIRVKDGKPLALSIYHTYVQPQNKQVLQLVSEQWAKVGVKLDVLPGDAGSVAADNLDPAKTPLLVAMVGRADPDVIKSGFYPKNRDWLLQVGGSSTLVQSYTDTELNGLLEAQTAEVDPAKRLEIIGDIQNHVLDQALLIPIFEEPQIFAAGTYVNGLEFEAVGRPSFYDTWLSER